MKPILLVEDNENDVIFMRRAMKLANIKHPIDVAENGREAIEYLSRQGRYQEKTLPILALLDIKLPLMTGLDVLSWIRRQPALHSLVVVILTSSADEKDIGSAYQLGVNSYLVKPATMEGLTAIVRCLGEYWLTHNHPAMQLPAMVEV